MILHIPHSSLIIPDDLRDQFVLSDSELEKEKIVMTDMFTDELYAFEGAESVIFPYSRLFVDVERFRSDADEPMSKEGMGVAYNKTAVGNELRHELLVEDKEHLLTQYYDLHHQKLTNAVQAELDNNGKALLIDCHSFPSVPLPCDNNQATPRPPFCIGTEGEHTPEGLASLTKKTLTDKGYEVGVNEPYAGSLVPTEFWQKDYRVSSIMIEINRNLYMDEQTGLKIDSFETIQKQIHQLLTILSRC